jgi:hypothetical protein
MVSRFDLVVVDVATLIKVFDFVETVIYKVKDYNFEYVKAADTGNYSICDCFPCNKYGEILKGYEYPIPIERENLISEVLDD